MPPLRAIPIVIVIIFFIGPRCPWSDLQGLSERMLKVNPFAWALIFTKSGFFGVFWDEK